MKQHIVERKIMWGDLDPLGIVFYPRYYEWIDACGHLFFESLGLKMGDLWKERKILFSLVETSCRYRQPGRYHQKIRVVSQIDELEKKLVALKYAIRRAEDDTLMVEGFEKRVCIDVSDPEDFRAIDIPEDIYGVLKDATD